MELPDFMSESSDLKPKLDSIFAEVENSLPSIDFDSSDVSSEDGDVDIFNRTVKSPTFDEDRDIDDKDFLLSLEKEIVPKSNTRQDAHSPQEAGDSMATITANQTTETDPHKYASELTPGQAEGPPPIKRDTWMTSQSHSQSGDSTRHNTLHVNIDEKRREVPELSPPSAEKPSSSPDTKDTRQGRKKLRSRPGRPKDHDNERRVVSQFMPAESPNLTLSQLDCLPWEQLLVSSPPQEAASLVPLLLPRPGPSSGETRRVPSDTDNISLLERLAGLSINQSGADLKEVDPITGAVTSRRRGRGSDLKEAKTAINMSLEAQVKRGGHVPVTKVTPVTKATASAGASASTQQITMATSGVAMATDSTSVGKKTASAGTSTTDLPKIITARPRAINTVSKTLKVSEPQTVYMDLRNFDQEKQTEKKSIRAVQRVLQITPDEQSSSSSEDEDDLQLWHEQRRKIKSTGTKTPTIKPQPPSEPKPSGVKRSAGTTQAQRLARPKATTTLPSVDQGHDETLIEDTKVKVKEEESEKKIAEARRLQEVKKRERESRVRLGQRLEALRPTQSHSGKQPVAKATPTLFDVESSYEPAPCSLPDSMPASLECLLLTVKLTSNGQISSHRGSGHRSIDSVTGLSATYPTLLTWFLSLVPDNYDFLQRAPVEPVLTPAPFHVIGLQQMYLDGQLMLCIAAAPVEQFTPKDLPSVVKRTKKREEGKGHTAFHQILTKFLSTNTLHSVCPWLADLVSLEVSSRVTEVKGQDHGDTPHYAYKPPLPSISTKPLSTFIQITQDPSAVHKVLNIPVGFFWETIDTEEDALDQSLRDELPDGETQNTMSLVYKKVYRDPRAMMGILNRVLQVGLDLSGLRLVYPTPDLMLVAHGLPSGSLSPRSESAAKTDMLNNIGPILAFALRGTSARTVWLDAVGPSDPVLARKTDPNSLCALYGGISREECLLFCPRNPARILSELVRWFGGRVPPSGVIDVGSTPQKCIHGNSSKRARKGIAETNTDVPSTKPPATLTASTGSDVFVAVSPLVPVNCLGLVIATCQFRGYQLGGVRRMRINTKRATHLGIADQQTFCPFEFENQRLSDHDVLRPVTVLLLHKENALQNSASLMEAFIVHMSMQGLLGSLADLVDGELTSAHLFHSAAYSDGLLASLGGPFTKVPEFELSLSPGFIQPQLHTNPEVEQVVVLTLTGDVQLRLFGGFLGRLLGVVPYLKSGPIPPSPGGFELLGLKWLASLSMHQAKELTPYEVGDREWRTSLQTLTSEPAIVLALRGVNAFERLGSIIHPQQTAQSQKASLDKLMSPTPEIAYHQMRLFFYDRELFADPSARTLLQYLPPIREGRTVSRVKQTQTASELKGKSKSPHDLVEESIISTMVKGPILLNTVLVIKPEAARKHLPRLMKRINQEGFLVVAMRLMMADENDLEKLLVLDPCEDTIVTADLRESLAGGPCVVLCLQRENAVNKLVELLGPADPQAAKRQSSLLWRAQFGLNRVRNGLMCSQDYCSSVADMKYFFPTGLCCQPTETLTAEGVSCLTEDTVLTIPSSRQIHLRQHAASDADNFTALTQTSCIILTPPLVKPPGRRAKVPYLDIVEGIHTAGFELVGMRMVWFTQRQAQQLCHTIHAGSFAPVPTLISGPSLILALQRDNAVMAFDTLLGGSFDQNSLIRKYGDQMIKPKDPQHAMELLKICFNSLMPGAQACITA